MRAARRRRVLGVVRRGTGPSSRLRARALLFNILFAAVTQVAYTRFEADKGIIDGLVGLRKKAGAGGRGEITSREPAPATSL